MTNDRSRLILTLPYEPGEAPHSFMSRLAMINGVNAAGFAFDQGIRFVDIVDGEADALARLADLSGTSHLGLQRAAFQRIDLRTFQRNGHSFERQHVKSPETPVCPQCLREDGRCCTTLSAEDSHRESMRLDGVHEQAVTRPLPHHELVQLHGFAAQARIIIDLVGQGHDLARAA